MKLIVMRHGEAESFAGSDAERRLTAAGERQAVTAAEQLRDAGFAPGLIYVSPLVRAQQTAQQAIEALGFTGQMMTLDQLQPEGSPVQVVAALSTSYNHDPLLVSHQPLVSRLVEYLTGERVAMKTASIAVIEMEQVIEGGGQLVCHIKG